MCSKLPFVWPSSAFLSVSFSWASSSNVLKIRMFQPLASARPSENCTNCGCRWRTVWVKLCTVFVWIYHLSPNLGDLWDNLGGKKTKAISESFRRGEIILSLSSLEKAVDTLNDSPQCGETPLLICLFIVPNQIPYVVVWVSEYKSFEKEKQSLV